MTALDDYAKLEALGQYVDGTGAPPREVVLGFGERTLIITDLSDNPLAHWPLASLRAIGAAGAPETEIAPDRASAERVRLDDAEMIRAISAVCPDLNAVPPLPPRPPRRIGRWVALAGVLAIAGALWWGSAHRERFAGHVDAERLAALGDAIEGHLIAAHGRQAGLPVMRCAGAAGQAALVAIAARLSEEGGLPGLRRITVLDLPDPGAEVLPGGIVILHRGLLDSARAPEQISHVLAHLMSHVAVRDPLRVVLGRADFLDAMALIVGGHFDEALVERGGRALSDHRPGQIEDAGASRMGAAALLAAGLPEAPLSSVAQEPGARLIRAHPALGTKTEGPGIEGAFRPALADRDWIALQNMCERRAPY